MASRLISVIVGALPGTPASALFIVLLICVVLILSHIIFTLPQLELGMKPSLLPFHCRELVV